MSMTSALLMPRFGGALQGPAVEARVARSEAPTEGGGGNEVAGGRRHVTRLVNTPVRGHGPDARNKERSF